MFAAFAPNGVLVMPRRQSKTAVQMQQLVQSNLQLAAAMHTYAQSNQQLAAAVAQLAEMAADDLTSSDEAPVETYLSGKPIR